MDQVTLRLDFWAHCRPNREEEMECRKPNTLCNYRYGLQAGEKRKKMRKVGEKVNRKARDETMKKKITIDKKYVRLEE